jgi:hypothetical protein
MFVLATGTFTDPSKNGPYVKEEIAQIRANHEMGLVVSQYFRADGKGVLFIWHVGSFDEARRHIREFPFSKRGLLNVELTELIPF